MKKPLSYTWPTWVWFGCLFTSLKLNDWLTALIVLLLAPLAMWYEQKLYEQSKGQP